MRLDAGSTAPTGSGRVKLISAIPTCETCLMVDTCAGGGICPRGSDQTAQKDTPVAITQFVTALDDSAHGNVDESHFRSDATKQMSVFPFRALARHRSRVIGSRLMTVTK